MFIVRATFVYICKSGKSNGRVGECLRFTKISLKTPNLQNKAIKYYLITTMPTYRSITMSLVSQFDILTIPEFAPPTTPTDPFSNAPTLVDTDHSIVSVYVPTYPSSQFWLSYSISPPHPPGLLYYFKLYLNGNLIVSWGCGDEDDYRGKTMFGLFRLHRSSGLAKGVSLERRVLCFCPDIPRPVPDSLSDVMEVRVFRSKARKRIKPEARTLQSAGIIPESDKKKHPQQQAAGGIK